MLELDIDHYSDEILESVGEEHPTKIKISVEDFFKKNSMLRKQEQINYYLHILSLYLGKKVGGSSIDRNTEKIGDKEYLVFDINYDK